MSAKSTRSPERIYKRSRSAADNESDEALNASEPLMNPIESPDREWKSPARQFPAPSAPENRESGMRADGEKMIPIPQGERKKVMRQLGIRIPWDMKLALKEIAFFHNLSTTALCVAALTALLKQEGKL